MKASGIGGQALMEGVMMKNGNHYACAVRKPDGTIEVDDQHTTSIGDKYKIFKLPIIRGVVTFIESLTIGVKTLTWSASFFEEDEETDKKEKEAEIKINTDETGEQLPGQNAEQENTAEAVQQQSSQINKAPKKEKKKGEGLMMALLVVLAIVFAVGLFMILPYFISTLLKKVIESQLLLATIEGLIRITLFIGYVAAISCMKDIRRVFMYHGAEHKSINCVENGYELTVENVRKCSKEHKRCGTSFILIVMVFSIILFMFVRFDSTILMVVGRLILIPLIAGLSYEFLRLAGRSDNKVINILSKPGLCLQKLTTREPDDSMIECAIASVEAVFDWKEFQEKLKAEEEEARQSKESQKARRRKERAEEIRLRREARGIIDTELSEEKIREIDAEADKLAEKDLNDFDFSESLARDAAEKARNLSEGKEEDKEQASGGMKESEEEILADIESRLEQETPSEEDEDDEVLKALNKIYDK